MGVLNGQRSYCRGRVLAYCFNRDVFSNIGDLLATGGMLGPEHYTTRQLTGGSKLTLILSHMRAVTTASDNRPGSLPRAPPHPERAAARSC